MQWLCKGRPSCPFCMNWPRVLKRTIYIYIDALGVLLVHVGLAQARPNNGTSVLRCKKAHYHHSWAVRRAWKTIFIQQPRAYLALSTRSRKVFLWVLMPFGLQRLSYPFHCSYLKIHYIKTVALSCNVRISGQLWMVQSSQSKWHWSSLESLKRHGRREFRWDKLPCRANVKLQLFNGEKGVPLFKTLIPAPLCGCAWWWWWWFNLKLILCPGLDCAL